MRTMPFCSSNPSFSPTPSNLPGLFPSRLPPLRPPFRHHQLPSECMDEFTTISSSLSYVERIVELSSNPNCSSPGGALHLHVHLHNSPLKRASLPPLQGTMTGLRVRPKLPLSVLSQSTSKEELSNTFQSAARAFTRWPSVQCFESS